MCMHACIKVPVAVSHYTLAGSVYRHIHGYHGSLQLKCFETLCVGCQQVYIHQISAMCGNSKREEVANVADV